MLGPLKFTIILTVGSSLICLYHWLGYDHDHIVLMQASIPAWILPLFVDIQQMNKYLFYTLSVGSWFGVGLLMDLAVRKYRHGNRSRV
ncbi:hypothetical protein [Marinicrinis sediminis]|uniref:Uncharacterized protein n=1 Tax=Marinicrinis sediminis TaxID=1652465 RepID=A0ABW5R651_9BACL